MRHSRILTIFVCTGRLLSVVDAGAGAPVRRIVSNDPCRAADAITVAHLHYVRTLSSSANPSSMRWRAGTHVTRVTDTATAVVAVSDSALCASALTAYNASARLTDSAATEIQLLRVDTVYVASHPSIRSGEFVMNYVFDRAFRLLGSYMR